MKTSLVILLRELNKIGISPTKFLANKFVREELTKKNIFKKTGAVFEVIGGSGDCEVEFPALLLINRNSDDANHVWFVTTNEEYDRYFGRHVGPGHEIELVIEVRKSKNKPEPELEVV